MQTIGRELLKKKKLRTNKPSLQSFQFVYTLWIDETCRRKNLKKKNTK